MAVGVVWFSWMGVGVDWVKLDGSRSRLGLIGWE